jgi:hypothetical protein
MPHIMVKLLLGDEYMWTTILFEVLREVVPY